jgi:hypothetical protein
LACVTKVPAKVRPSGAEASQAMVVLPGAGVEKVQAPTAGVGLRTMPLSLDVPVVTRLIGCSGSVSSVRSCCAPVPLKLSVRRPWW